MLSANITAIVNTYNEASNIRDCIESIHLVTKSVLVVDTESTDNTIEIARDYNAEIINYKRSYFVEPVRQFSIENVSTGWVLILDADERITPELAAEITKVISDEHLPATDSQLQPTHYRIPRKNIYAHIKWLRHGGWYPDYQIRLFKRDAFITWPQNIHATPQFKGVQGHLKNPMLHYIHSDVESMVNKTVVFEEIEADLLFRANRTVQVPTFFRKFLSELFRRLIKNRGFMDGTYGVIESIYQAFSKTITYLYLYEKKNSRPL